MKFEELAPCVFLYKNAFSGGDNFVSLIEEECSQDWGYLQWVRAEVGDGYISEIRTSMACELAPLGVENIEVERVIPIKEAWIEIFKGIDATVWHYREENELNLQEDEGYRVLKYGRGAEYRAHHDHGPGNSRVLSLVAFLNDDFSGGELVFPKFDLTIKPEAGSCVLFPSNFPYTHIAEPAGVDDGTTKYSLVTWFR